ncbi:MAG TPA: YfhO family protein [Patescibacteria group bacterium]|nr:YfhO family protein [Patescibacteria group bacterium]
MKKFFLRFLPILFIVSVWIGFSSPYFFQQKVPYPSKYQVTFFGPWSHYEEFAGPVKNNAMSDVIGQIYPWKYLTIQILKQGELPLWNPYNFAGTPHLANFQTAVFSPFNLLFFIFPFIDAWSLLILSQALLAGLFIYLFVRELGVSKAGAVLSSIAFMFCGFMVVWLAYGTLSMAIAFLPLVLFAIERFFQRKSIIALVLVSVGVAVSFFSGHIQTSLYVAVFSAFYLCFKLITTRNFRRFCLVGLFFLLGLGISCIQVLPTFSLYEASVRSSLVVAEGEIPLSHLVTIFAPDFYGNPVTRNDWIGFYAEWAMFIGIIPFILSIFSFFGRKQTVWFFTLIGVLALAFASDTPLRQLLAVSGIPVFSTSIPSRMIVLFSFSFAVLAGFGLDSLQTLLKENAKKKIFLVLGISGIALVFVWSILLVFHGVPLDKSSIAQKNLLLPTGLFVCLTAVVLVQLFFSYKKVVPIAIFFIIVFATFDSFRFATKWMPFDDRNLVFPDVKVIKTLQEQIGNGRVFGSLGTQVESYYGLSSLEGYDPLYIQRYGEFISSSWTGDYHEAERSVVQISNGGVYTERVLDLLGVSVIFHPKSDTFVNWAFPVWANKEKYTPFYEDDRFQLFTNTTALPRAKLFTDYEVIADGKSLLKRFYAQDFDFRNVLLLEDNPELGKSKNIPAGKVQIVSYEANKVVISVSSDTPALLFLSDSYYPNWQAFVNGSETKVYRADYAFRAVKVPKGTSEVIFIYKKLF